MKADYPLRFVNSVINEFQKGKDHGDKRIIVPPDFFGTTKKFFISIEIRYREVKEIKFKNWLKKFHKITNNGFRVIKTWKARNIRSLCHIKNKTIINRAYF